MTGGGISPRFSRRLEQSDGSNAACTSGSRTLATSTTLLVGTSAILECDCCVDGSSSTGEAEEEEEPAATTVVADVEVEAEESCRPVSYTHLTLPTILRV